VSSHCSPRELHSFPTRRSSDLPDAYLSVAEALKHGGYACGAQVEIDWIASDDAEGLLAEGRLRDLDGVVIPGGFGFRGIEGKIADRKSTRLNSSHGSISYAVFC